MKFPYKAFKLTPTFHVKEVTVTGEIGRTNWFKVEKGRNIHFLNLYASVADAVAAGKANLQKQRKHVITLMAGIEQRESNLSKAKA